MKNAISELRDGVINLGLGVERLGGIKAGLNDNDVVIMTQLNSTPFTSPIIYSSEKGITAYAGGGQANATQLTKQLNIVETVASAADSVKLPVAVAGLQITIKNAAYPNTLAVFPSTGGDINDGTVNASINVNADSTIVFIAIDSTTWEVPTNVNTDVVSESYSGSGVTIDGVLIKDGVLRGLAALTSATGSLNGTFIIANTKQSISGAGAINITSHKTEITTTGSDAYTLVDGVVTGQLKKIHMIAYGGTGTLQPANIAINNAILFRVVGDEATLMWDGSNWVIIDTSSVVGDGQTPTIV